MQVYLLGNRQQTNMSETKMLPSMAQQEVKMEIRGSIQEINKMEKRLTKAFNHICVKDGSSWLDGYKPKTFTRIQELYPDSANPLQHTVWLRFTYCLTTGRAQMQVSSRDVARFMRAIAERNIRLGLNGEQNNKEEAQIR